MTSPLSVRLVGLRRLRIVRPRRPQIRRWLRSIGSGSSTPLPPTLELIRALAVTVAVVSGAIVAQFVVIGGLQQRADSQQAFDRLRGELANGTAPVGPVDTNGFAVDPGDPIGYVEIPALDLRQVVVDGTRSSDLFTGPGHRRDTVYPGQAGVSMILGRRAGFGGPFGSIGRLRRGDDIRVTTGQGVFDFEVVGTRVDGDPVPPMTEGSEARLILVTAGGSRFLPAGVLRVDADLVGEPAQSTPVAVAPAALSAAERIMGADTSTLWALALWLQVLIGLTLGFVWCWNRWGTVRSWLVFLPPLVLAGLGATGEAARLVPNLL